LEGDNLYSAQLTKELKQNIATTEQSLRRLTSLTKVG